jgi:hypothetical protein
MAAVSFPLIQRGLRFWSDVHVGPEEEETVLLVLQTEGEKCENGNIGGRTSQPPERLFGVMATPLWEPSQPFPPYKRCRLWLAPAWTGS